MIKVSVLVNSKNIDNLAVVSLAIKKDIDMATLEASLTVRQAFTPVNNLFDDIIYNGFEDFIKDNDIITIKFNDSVMFVGYVASVDVAIDKNADEVLLAKIQLKQKSYDFYSSSNRGSKSFSKNLTLYNLILNMLGNNNFKVINDNFEFAKDNEIGVLFDVQGDNIQETTRLTSGGEFYQQRLLQDTGIVNVKIPNVLYYSIDDTNFTFLTRIAQQFNINLTSDEYGNIVLYKPNLKNKIPKKIDNKTIQRVSIQTDISNLFYEYQMRGKTQFKSKKNGVRVKYESSSFDRAVRPTRFAVVNSRMTLNGQNQQMIIDGYAGVERCRSKILNIELPFLTRSEVDLGFFNAGDLVAIDLRENPAYKNQTNGIFLIKAIEYNYSVDQPTKTTLELVEKNYFNAEALKINKK